MEESASNASGYVYILEVKDIVLPVCKIGMTRRTPHERCEEINNSSTGDFIWSVAHYIAVDNCQKLESLVHSKLAPLRQKGREFFNISADDAHIALSSILDNQVEIKEADPEELGAHRGDLRANNRKRNRQVPCRKKDAEYARLLQLFVSILNVKGQPFGQLNRPIFGISDGNKGVQRNLAVSTDTGAVRVGVNLEGMKYKHWPISKFILSELDCPRIFEMVSKLGSPDNIYVRFSRDAWQVTSRPPIVEELLGGKECSLSEMNANRWMCSLEEALTCLDEEKNHCGRAKQAVTLVNKPKNGGQIRTMEVSPHITIWSPLSLVEDMQEELERKIEELEPVYVWMKETSG